jgi:succinyl-CoA synthetase beta subunit
LAKYGCAVPRGIVASTDDEVTPAMRALGGSVVVKAQVLSGKRGKAGGVRFASTPEEARKAAADLLCSRINGMYVRNVLVAEALHIKKEFYIALTVDRRTRSVACMVSASGGMDIEDVAQNNPDEIFTCTLPARPLREPVPTSALEPVFANREIAALAARAISSLHRLFCENDCLLAEVNPYVLTEDGSFVAADAKITVDDNALYRHPDLEVLRNDDEYGESETAARRAGLSFVGLDGSIGCMVNGAGLAMATMDIILLSGGKPANFLDVGGSSNPQKVVDAFRILSADKNIKVVLVNIFGGITRCDDIARGILRARELVRGVPPLVVRLTGTNEDEARALLAGAGIESVRDMYSAVKSAVALGGRAS